MDEETSHLTRLRGLPRKKQAILLSISVFVLITSLAVAMSFFNISWSELRHATCWPRNCFCEAPRAETIIQPVNTYSNLGFVLVGLLIVGTAENWWLGIGHYLVQKSPPGRNLIRRRRAYPIIYGIATVVIGVGSLFYHASLSFVGEWFDLVGMYMLVSFSVLYSLARLYDWSNSKFVFFYVSINILLGLQQYFFPTYSQVIFGTGIALALVMETLYRIQHYPLMAKSYFFASFGAFMLAWGIWLLDVHGILCDPRSWMQGHAVWHLLCATAAGLLYMYYRSERNGFPGEIKV